MELALAFVARVPDRYPPGAKGRPTAEGALVFRLPDRVLYGDSHQSLVDQLLNAGTFEHSISGKAAAPLPTAGREAFSAHVIRQLETLGVGSLGARRCSPYSRRTDAARDGKSCPHG